MPLAGASNLWSLEYQASGQRSHGGFRACSCLLGYVVEWLWLSHWSLRTWVSWCLWCGEWLSWFMNLQGSVVLVTGCHHGPRRALGLLKYGHWWDWLSKVWGPHISLLSCFRCLALQLWALDRLHFLSVSVWSKWRTFIFALGSETILLWVLT